jgi:CheY-like chemotaxis protein
MVEDSNKKQYCPSCGEYVDTYSVDRGGVVGQGGVVTATDRHEDVCCIFCGMIVEDKAKDEVMPAKSILICDDSAMIRELLSDVLRNNNLSEKVVASSDGSDFITLFSKNVSEKTPFSLVVLDVAMPILNGINAAIAMRAIEKALQMKATPILFFTAHKCDDNFKKVLSFCKPALYINKGVSSTPDQLGARIGHVSEQLLRESQRGLDIKD